MWMATSRRSLCSDVMSLSAMITHEVERSSSRSTTLVYFVAFEKSIDAARISSGPKQTQF